jgi:DNA-binding response OmpR family regulator
MTVAVFNSSDDTVEMLALVLEQHGFHVVKGHVTDVKSGVTDFVNFVAKHDPRAIIWDVSPPYDENWKFLQLLRSSDSLDGRCLVVTTTHKQHLDKLANADTGALEIIGKPYDLNLVVKAIQGCLSLKPSTESS